MTDSKVVFVWEKQPKGGVRTCWNGFKGRVYQSVGGWHYWGESLFGASSGGVVPTKRGAQNLTVMWLREEIERMIANQVWREWNQREINKARQMVGHRTPKQVLQSKNSWEA